MGARIHHNLYCGHSTLPNTKHKWRRLIPLPEEPSFVVQESGEALTARLGAKVMGSILTMLEGNMCLRSDQKCPKMRVKKEEGRYISVDREILPHLGTSQSIPDIDPSSKTLP